MQSRYLPGLLLQAKKGLESRSLRSSSNCSSRPNMSIKPDKMDMLYLHRNFKQVGQYFPPFLLVQSSENSEVVQVQRKCEWTLETLQNMWKLNDWSLSAIRVSLQHCTTVDVHLVSVYLLQLVQTLYKGHLAPRLKQESFPLTYSMPSSVPRLSPLAFLKALTVSHHCLSLIIYLGISSLAVHVTDRLFSYAGDPFFLSAPWLRKYERQTYGMPARERKTICPFANHQY